MDGKTGKYHGLIDTRIATLITLEQRLRGATEIPVNDLNLILETIYDLEQVVPKYGLSENNLVNLVDMLLDNGNRRVLRNSYKSRLISCLLPVYHVPNSVVMNVIGSIGINTSNDKQFIHKNLQTKLLRWLYLNLAVNNVDGFEAWKAFVPVIFSLVNVEYATQWISLVLIKVLVHFKNDKVFIRSALRPWRLRSLLKLDRSLNGTDQYLSALIMVFQQLAEVNDDRTTYEVSRALKEKRLNVFKHPSLNYIYNLVSIKINNSVGSLTLDDTFIENLALSLQTFGSLDHLMNAKKRKLDTFESEPNVVDLITAIDTDTVTGFKNNDKLSMVDFIETYNDVTHEAMPIQLGSIVLAFANLKENVIEIGELMEIPTIDTSIYSSLFNLHRFHDRIANWCEVVLLDADNVINVTETNCKLVQKIFSGLTNMQSITGEMFAINYKILCGEVIIKNETKELVFDFVSNFKSIPISKLEKVVAHVLRGAQIGAAVDALGGLVDIFESAVHKDPELINKIYKTVLHTIPEILVRGDKTVQLELQLLRFIRYSERIEFKDIDLENLILPPPVSYFFLLSSNPAVISEFCKHITFAKRYFSDYYSTVINTVKDEAKQERLVQFKNLHNSYVMDICNLLWRNKALEYHLRSSSKAMLLPQTFVNQLQKFTMVTEEDLKIEFFFKKAFSIVLNPAFSNIVLKLVRDLEDLTNCNIRYVGPIDDEYFYMFIKELDPNSQNWIPNIKDLDDFKVLILNELDKKTQFNGVSELLFNSLKSLLKRRT